MPHVNVLIFTMALISECSPTISVYFGLFQYEWPDVDEQEGLRETMIVYKFAYLPAGLFNRTQVGVEANYYL